MKKRYLISFLLLIVLIGGFKTASASTLTTWQNMVSNGTTTLYWYDENNLFLNTYYYVFDLNNFPFWQATTTSGSGSLATPYLKQPATSTPNWDYSITIPTNSEGYKFWLLSKGTSDTNKIFRYKYAGNWNYSGCTTLKSITLADKVLNLARCNGVINNPITNVMLSTGEPDFTGIDIYLMVYTDDDLDTLITDETTMYNYLDNLANYNSMFGGWSSTTPITLPAGTCDNLDIFSGALCRVITFLFVPSSTSLNQFSNLKDMISTKPPFGYWTSIKNTLNTLSSTSTPAFALTSAINDISLFNTLKTDLAWILWIFFAFWVIRRIATFDF